MVATLTWPGTDLRRNLVAFGLSHNFTQVGYLRPQNRHSDYQNLYFTGSSTHPGTGLPIVLLSARLTTERILEDRAPVHKAQTLASPSVSEGSGS